MMLKVAICDDNKSMLDFLIEKVDAILTENRIPPKNDGIALYISTDTRKRFYALADRNILNFEIFLEIVLCETLSFRAIALLL